MILGLSITTYTLLHTVLSLVGIVAGLVVAGALASGTRLDRWAAVFVVTTVLANASGFGFPSVRSEEHTSELQSHSDLVCRLLLEKKKDHEDILVGTHTELAHAPASQPELLSKYLTRHPHLQRPSRNEPPNASHSALT